MALLLCGGFHKINICWDLGGVGAVAGCLVMINCDDKLTAVMLLVGYCLRSLFVGAFINFCWDPGSVEVYGLCEP